MISKVRLDGLLPVQEMKASLPAVVVLCLEQKGPTCSVPDKQPEKQAVNQHQQADASMASKDFRN